MESDIKLAGNETKVAHVASFSDFLPGKNCVIPRGKSGYEASVKYFACTYHNIVARL